MLITKARRFGRLALAGALLSLLILTVGVVAAQDGQPTRPVTDDEVNEVARELFCPVCESTPLDVCATQACADWREVIRTKLSEGQSAEEIKEYFATQYGDRALAEPPRRGFNIMVWLLPILAVAVGLVFFARYMTSLRQPAARPATPAAEGPARQDEYLDRLERELRDQES
jgi:cytochrome c-type biogenesis protein CcmH